MGTIKNITSIIKWALIVVALILVVGIAGKYTGFLGKLGNLFGGPLKIDKTANVITEIKKISEFTTAVYYEECVLQDQHYKVSEKTAYKKVSTGSIVKDALGLGKEAEGVIVDSTVAGRIAIIVHGKVRAGFDLSKLEEGDIKINGDTLSVRLPEAEIFDIIVNPSDVEIFHSSGEWKDDEVSNIISTSKSKIESDAIKFGLLERATTLGKEKFINLFKTFGFECVKYE